MASITCAAEPLPEPTPEWIWGAQADRHGSSSVELRRTFLLTAPVESARLRATSDFAALSIVINGHSVATLEPYDPTFEIDVTRHLIEGDNAIVASADGVAGPSAVALSLEIRIGESPPVWIETDARWQTTDTTQVTQWGRVHAHRWALNRLPEVSPFAEYNQWKEALESDVAAALSPLPAGFEITKIRDAQEGEDSWIALAIAPDERLIIGKEDQGLLRLTLSQDGTEVVAVDTIGEALQECRGLTWRGDSLYVHANRSGGVFRLRDTDGDDRFSEVTHLLSTEGGTGHGRNALVLAPDDSLHAIVGDDIAVPEGAPRRARPEGAKIRELGHQARLRDDAEGASWEALNRGLRNPYGIDFNADGEAFTFDADNEGDLGLPLYRPTRINHLVSGANYGWHQTQQNTRSLPVYAADSWPTNFDVGRGSPTAVQFGTHSHFPAPWRQAMFALDWSYGRILAVHLTPRGGSYYGSGEVFLEGRPLNVTDLDFDREGSMWFVTGGRKTRSSLYRVRYNGTATGVDQPGTEQAAARAEFSARARDRRRVLEGFHAPTDPAAINVIWPSLADADPWIRGAARVALEWQPLDQWRERALASADDLGGLTAMLALVRCGNDQDRRRAAERIAETEPTDWGRNVKLTWLRIHQLADCSGDAQLRQQIAEQLIPIAQGENEAVKREVAAGLVMLDSPLAVPYGLQQLASATHQGDRLHYLQVLSKAASGWSSQQRRQYFTALAYAKRFSAGDRFLPPFLQAAETSALDNVLDPAERSEFAKMLTRPVETQPVRSEARPLIQNWTVANFVVDGRSSDQASGDAKRGREAFVAASCANCHVCGSTGNPVGPNLSTVARRFHRRDLLESIVEPSKVIAEAYRNVVVLHGSGTVTTGRIIRDDFRESQLILAPQADAPLQWVTIPKAEIESWKESSVSPMPAGLLDTLTRREVEDLLAFLLAGGEAE